MSGSLATTIRAANRALIVEGNLEAVGDYFAPDYVAHFTERDLAEGHGFIRRFVGMIRRAFPELRVEVEILVESRDRVAWQRTLRGIQRGDFMGFPASGRVVVWRDMITSRFRDGLIAEDWAISDLAERLLRAP
jgi:predicted ester cyclase